MSSSTAPTWTSIRDLVDIWISACFFFWETPFWLSDLIQLWIWITVITHLIIDDLRLSNFLTYHTSDAILGHIFVSIEIYRSSWSCMLISTYEVHTKMMTYLLSYHDLPGEPLLSHSIRLTPYGIWTSSCFSSWDSPFLSVGSIQLWTRMTRIAHSMMDDLISSDFSTLHTSDAILGHIFYSVEICRSSLICMIITSCKMYLRLMTHFDFVLIL